MRAKLRNAKGGFTLFELVLVIAGLSAWAAYTITAHFKEPTVTLESAAILIAKDLRTAQNRSAYLGEPAVLEFDADGYRLLDLRGRIVRHPRTQQPFLRSWSVDAVFDGVTLDSASFEGSTSLSFDGVGTVSAGGTVRISYEGAVRTVLVQRSSGRIEILRSTSGWRDHGR